MKLLVKLIYFLLIVVETTLLFRIILMVIGAEEGNGFISSVVSLSDIFIYPWRGILNMDWTIGTVFVDVDAIFSLIMYMVFGFGISELIKMLSYKD
ncbi:MAG: hypothetical protein ABIC57_00780 [bacterium]